MQTIDIVGTLTSITGKLTAGNRSQSTWYRTLETWRMTENQLSNQLWKFKDHYIQGS